MPKLGRAPKQLGSPDLAYAQILYTFREVALYLRPSEATVRRWHNERPLPMTVLGNTFVRIAHHPRGESRARSMRFDYERIQRRVRFESPVTHEEGNMITSATEIKVW